MAIIKYVQELDGSHLTRHKQRNKDKCRIVQYYKLLIFEVSPLSKTN